MVAVARPRRARLGAGARRGDRPLARARAVVLAAGVRRARRRDGRAARRRSGGRGPLFPVALVLVARRGRRGLVRRACAARRRRRPGGRPRERLRRDPASPATTRSPASASAPRRRGERSGGRRRRARRPGPAPARRPRRGRARRGAPRRRAARAALALGLALRRARGRQRVSRRAAPRSALLGRARPAPPPACPSCATRAVESAAVPRFLPAALVLCLLVATGLAFVYTELAEARAEPDPAHEGRLADLARLRLPDRSGEDRVPAAEGRRRDGLDRRLGRPRRAADRHEPPCAAGPAAQVLLERPRRRREAGARGRLPRRGPARAAREDDRAPEPDPHRHDAAEGDGRRRAAADDLSRSRRPRRSGRGRLLARRAGAGSAARQRPSGVCSGTACSGAGVSSGPAGSTASRFGPARTASPSSRWTRPATARGRRRRDRCACATSRVEPDAQVVIPGGVVRVFVATDAESYRWRLGRRSGTTHAHRLVLRAPTSRAATRSSWRLAVTRIARSCASARARSRPPGCEWSGCYPGRARHRATCGPSHCSGPGLRCEARAARDRRRTRPRGRGRVRLAVDASGGSGGARLVDRRVRDHGAARPRRPRPPKAVLARAVADLRLRRGAHARRRAVQGPAAVPQALERAAAAACSSSRRSSRTGASSSARSAAACSRSTPRTATCSGATTFQPLRGVVPDRLEDRRLRDADAAVAVPPRGDRGPAAEPSSRSGARDGKVLWQFTRPASSSRRRCSSATSSTSARGTASLYALDVRTRKVRWTFEADDELNSSPAYSQRDGLRRLRRRLASTRVDARTGEERWRAQSYSHFPNGREYFYATPAVAYGRVYIGNTDGTMYAFGARPGTCCGRSTRAPTSTPAPRVWQPHRLRRLLRRQRSYAFDAGTGDVPLDVRRAARRSTARRASCSATSSTSRPAARAATRAAATRSGPARDGRARTRAPGKLVWTFPDGQYSPVVADSKRLYLAGRARGVRAHAPRPAARTPLAASTRRDARSPVSGQTRYEVWKTRR